MKHYTRLIFPIILFLTAILYFSPIWNGGLIPFPGRLVVSFFSPWKEEAWTNYPAGVPRKDLLGFDTARMMGPWRHFITSELKQGRAASWNPHQFAGAPLSANFQSAIFFPPNLLYLVLPFSIAWTILVVAQPLLAAIGMFFLLKSLYAGKKQILNDRLLVPSFLSIMYGFSGWMSVWIEWNTLGFIYAILPWMMLGINKKSTMIITVAATAIITAGHPQMALIALAAGLLFSVVNNSFKKFLSAVGIALAITAVQWIPTLRYYQEASRGQQSGEFAYEKTFFPWRQIPQLAVPNYFGNPATENFRGQSDFVETTAYSGIAILGFALIGFMSHMSQIGRMRQIKTFAGLLLLLTIALVLPNPISLLIGKLGIPILSSSIASRWLLFWPLATVLLAAVGFDRFIGNMRTFRADAAGSQCAIKSMNLYFPEIFMFILIGTLWLAAFFSPPEFRSVSIRNLIIPTGIAVLWVTVAAGNKLLRSPAIVHRLHSLRLNIKTSRLNLLLAILLLASIYELAAFGHKTMTYTEKDFVYPSTPVIEKLQELSADYSRFSSTPGSAIESNFATYFGLYDAAGYDALYPRRIGELVWAAQEGGAPIADFSRSTVVTPTDPSPARDNLWNITGVRWIINKDDLLPEHPGRRSDAISSDFKLIWEKEKWQIYENMNAFPRAFFISDARWIGDGNGLIEKTLASPPDAASVIPEKITIYQSNLVKIEADAPTGGYLILTDTFSPGWKAAVDGRETKILPAFHAFRALPLAAGSHRVEFRYTPFY